MSGHTTKTHDRSVRPVTRLLDLACQQLLPLEAYLGVSEQLYRKALPPARQLKGVIDPFARIKLSPGDIHRYSGRDRNLRAHASAFGAVWDGDWDRHPPRMRQLAHRLTIGRTIDETIFYASLVQHFMEGCAWEDTPLIQGLLRLTDCPGYEWTSYGSPKQIALKCRELDRMFTDVAVRGVISHRDLIRERGLKVSFIDVALGEVIVDVGRDGEPLLVDGKHRVAMAKILGLDEIPVLVAVRHKQHVDRLIGS
jgi:hypothetical protein